MKELLNRLFPVGRRSLLFGVHQVIWHPFTVLLAWIKLYGLPSWRELVCIFIHDLGYWGCWDMDGPDGKDHPRFAAYLAYNWFGEKYAAECLLHSRHFARSMGSEPSRLCYADKLSIIFEPWWLYLPRAWLTGELHEYRLMAAKSGFVPLAASHREWFNWVKDVLSAAGIEQCPDAVPTVLPKTTSNVSVAGSVKSN